MTVFYFTVAYCYHNYIEYNWITVFHFSYNMAILNINSKLTVIHFIFSSAPQPSPLQAMTSVLTCVFDPKAFLHLSLTPIKDRLIPSRSGLSSFSRCTWHMATLFTHLTHWWSKPCLKPPKSSETPNSLYRGCRDDQQKPSTWLKRPPTSGIIWAAAWQV